MFFLKNEFVSAIFISLKLSFLTTLILIIVSLPLALWLSFYKSKLKILVEILVTLPLVLPPSVMGFYLLILLNKNSLIGKFWYQFTGEDLVFNFSGLLIGSVIYSLPFVVRPIQNSFSMVPRSLLEAASTLGSGPIDRFFSIMLPCAKNGILTGALLAFTHTLGEFGIVLMLGGNIPGKTKTVSIAIFDSVEQLDYAQAGVMSLMLLIVSVVSISIIYVFNRNESVL